MGKTPKINVGVTGKKTPVVIETPVDFHGMPPVWSFLKVDMEHKKWGITSCADCLNRVVQTLRDFERMGNWGEVLRLTCGRKGRTRNHPIAVSEICRDAQKRLSELNMDDADNMYSLALGGKLRIWGIMQDAVLRIVWIDPNHEIFPVEN